MAAIVKTKYHDSEVAKSADFGHTASSPVEVLCSILEGSFQDVEKSFVVSGLEVIQSDPATMNVLIKAGLAFDRFGSKILHLDSDLLVAVNASNAIQDRVDTLEVRYLETGFDTETRAFKDPVNGNVSYMDVPTRTLVGIEARCLPGELGANTAPLTEFGWVKLAEIRVQAGDTAIYDADIQAITAERDGVENATWTVERAESFRLGSIDALKQALYAHETSHVTGAASAHGIRQGHANGFDSDMLDGMQPASAASATTVMARDAAGRSKIAAPSDSDDIARKDTIDNHAALAGSSAHGATSAATASQIMSRDASGRAKVAAPDAADDIARKDTVDAEAALARNADNLGSGTVALDRIPNTLTGKDADTLDGFHASSFARQERTAGSYVEYYHSVGKNNGSNSKVVEFKVQKTGTYTTRIFLGAGFNENISFVAGDLIQLYAYTTLTGSNSYTVYARVYKNGVAVGTARSYVAGDIGGNYSIGFGLMCAEEGYLYSLG